MFLNNLTTLMPVLLLHVHVSLECNYVDVVQSKVVVVDVCCLMQGNC